jgi:hypothetical protein
VCGSNIFVQNQTSLPKGNFHKTLPRLVEKTNELYVLSTLVKCYFAIANFDLWMSKGIYDVFALVINFLSSDW